MMLQNTLIVFFIFRPIIILNSLLTDSFIKNIFKKTFSGYIQLKYFELSAVRLQPSMDNLNWKINMFYPGYGSSIFKRFIYVCKTNRQLNIMLRIYTYHAAFCPMAPAEIIDVY